MTKTNSLTSHQPERYSSRVDKMANNNDVWYIGKNKHYLKKLANKKRRQLLKQNTEDKI